MGDVALSWQLSDSESDITGTAGCDPTSIATDGLSIIGCSATSSGGTATASVTVRRDATPPVVATEVTPMANPAGWHSGAVMIRHACTDATSGVASSPAAQNVDTEGADRSVPVVGNAADTAGNVAVVEPVDLNIDTTPPTMAIAVPEDGAVYFLGEVVPLQWSASNALSGLASASGTVADGGSLDTSSAGTFSFAVSAEDVAENMNAQSVAYSVLSPADAAQWLSVRTEGAVAQAGIRNALTSKLNQASRRFATGRTKAANNIPGAFIQHVSAQAGKRIDAAAAAELIGQASRLMAVMPI